MKLKSFLKLVILFLIVFGMTIKTYSQVDSTYVPFPTDSVAWNETSCGWDGLTLEVECYNQFIFMIGDTIQIDSISYTAIYQGNMVFDTSTAQLLGGIREENKKVYFKEIGNQSSSEILYYDFSVSVGDTVRHITGGAFGVLNSIDSILLENNTFRRRFNFWESHIMDYSSPIIEGLGNISSNTGGVLHLRFAFFEGSNRVNCVIKPGEVVYKNSNIQDHNCHVLGVSINEVEKISNSIFPNPFENVLNFKEKVVQGDVTIFSITGKMVFEKESFSGNELDLSSLEKGVYFIEIFGEKRTYNRIVKL